MKCRPELKGWRGGEREAFAHRAAGCRSTRGRVPQGAACLGRPFAPLSPERAYRWRQLLLRAAAAVAARPAFQPGVEVRPRRLRRHFRLKDLFVIWACNAIRATALHREARSPARR